MVECLGGNNMVKQLKSYECMVIILIFHFLCLIYYVISAFTDLYHVPISIPLLMIDLLCCLILYTIVIFSSCIIIILKNQHQIYNMLQGGK